MKYAGSTGLHPGEHQIQLVSILLLEGERDPQQQRAACLPHQSSELHHLLRDRLERGSQTDAVVGRFRHAVHRNGKPVHPRLDQGRRIPPIQDGPIGGHAGDAALLLCHPHHPIDLPVQHGFSPAREIHRVGVDHVLPDPEIGLHGHVQMGILAGESGAHFAFQVAAEGRLQIEGDESVGMILAAHDSAPPSGQGANWEGRLSVTRPPVSPCMQEGKLRFRIAERRCWKSFPCRSG